MARRLASGASAATASLPSAAIDDFSMGAWVMTPATPSATVQVFYCGVGSSNGWGIEILNTGQTRAQLVGAQINGASMTNGTWAHVCLSRIGGTSTFYFNGASQGTSATAPTQPTVSAFISNFFNSNPLCVAECFISQGRGLVANEVLGIARGSQLWRLNPYPINGGFPVLTLWVPLWGKDSPEPDIANSYQMTVTGSWTEEPHPALEPFTKRSNGVAYLTKQQQTAYRWRNDDGDEVSATWRANENTAISLARNERLRLRVQVNNVGDQPSQITLIQVRKQGTQEWRPLRLT